MKICRKSCRQMLPASTRGYKDKIHRPKTFSNTAAIPDSDFVFLPKILNRKEGKGTCFITCGA